MVTESDVCGSGSNHCPGSWAVSRRQWARVQIPNSASKQRGLNSSVKEAGIRKGVHREVLHAVQRETGISGSHEKTGVMCETGQGPKGKEWLGGPE